MTVSTNNVTMARAVEQSLGTRASSPRWFQMEPNDIGRFGSTLTTEARNPIREDRQGAAPIITDLESGVEVETDLTFDQMYQDVPEYLFARWVGAAVFTDAESLAGASGAYTVSSGGSLAQNTLVFGRGFTNAANNGLKVVGSGSTGTNIPVSGVVAEASPPNGARLEVAGVRGASGDFEIDASGNLISTTLDFTTLGLSVGQIIHVGGLTSTNQFAQSANLGLCRILSIDTNEIALENRPNTFVTDNGAGRQVDLLFGRFCRPVAESNADYVFASSEMEMVLPGLGSGGATRYWYSNGNLLNTVALNLSLNSKATGSLTWVGLDTPPPVSVRATNADSPRLPVASEGLSTASDIARLRFGTFDNNGFGTCFKSLEMSISNNATPEKCLGSLAAQSIALGEFSCTLTSEVLFTDEAVITALRNNETANLDFCVRNADGAMAFDLPAFKLGGGAPTFPRNESVRLSLEATAFKHPALGYAVSVSSFPALPAAA